MPKAWCGRPSRTYRYAGSRRSLYEKQSTPPGATLSDDNVIPFRKRPPSEAELEMYRRITRTWSAQMKEIFFPEHFRLDREKHGHSE
jgi:hypothetical protein